VAGKFNKPAVESLVTAMSARLRRHSPFDGMEDDALRFVAERISLVMTGAPRRDRGIRWASRHYRPRDPCTQHVMWCKYNNFEYPGDLPTQ
jgi:hypothetical protein